MYTVIIFRPCSKTHFGVYGNYADAFKTCEFLRKNGNVASVETL